VKAEKCTKTTGVKRRKASHADGTKKANLLIEKREEPWM